MPLLDESVKGVMRKKCIFSSIRSAKPSKSKPLLLGIRLCVIKFEKGTRYEFQKRYRYPVKAENKAAVESKPVLPVVNFGGPQQKKASEITGKKS
jgi:hypothetical protein